MAQATDTVAHRWFEQVWNQQREDAIDELLAKDCIAHGLVDATGAEVRGPEGFKAFYRGYRQMFPDMRISVEDTVVEGDSVAARCVVTATHTGPGITSAPTGKPVTITGMCFLRIKDGQIAEAWNNFDFLTLYQQLGMRLT